MFGRGGYQRGGFQQRPPHYQSQRFQHQQNSYNSFVPHNHDGHDSDGSGEYDRLGYETHQVPGGSRHQHQLPPHQQFFQNQFGQQGPGGPTQSHNHNHHPNHGPPRHPGQYPGPEQHFQGHGPPGHGHPGQGQMMGQGPGPPGAHMMQQNIMPGDDYRPNNHDMSRHSTVNEERHYIDHLRRRLDTLLNAANAIDFEAGQAASAWNDYQRFSTRNQPTRQSGRSMGGQPMRRSASMKSLNRDQFNDDNMSRSFDAQSMGGQSMGGRSMGGRSMGNHGGFDRHSMGPGGQQMGGQQIHQRGMPHSGHPMGPGGHPMGGGHTYTNVIPDTNSVDYSTDPRGQPGDARDPRGSLGRRSNRGSIRRPPDGMDMRGSLRGSGRGGVITQEELKRRIEHQQKENELRQSQLNHQAQQNQFFNQNNQNMLKQKIYEQNHLRFQMPTKSPSPLQSIGRPADFYGQKRFAHGIHSGFIDPRLHQHHMHHQMMGYPMHQINPYGMPMSHVHHHGAHFLDDQRLGTLSEPGAHFADLTDLQSEIGKPMNKGLKGLSASVPDLTGQFSVDESETTFRPISPDLADPTIAARQRAAELEELKKSSKLFATNLAKKEETNNMANMNKETFLTNQKKDTISSIREAAEQRRLAQAQKYESESDSSDGSLPSKAQTTSESVFLKSLSALRENVLTPAGEDATLSAGRLVGALGISSDNSDNDLDDSKSTSSLGRKKAVRFSVPQENLQDD